MEYKRFRIPNRDVKLTPSEARVTRTRAFQRLFYLKQLGLAYLVYPCATHTRAGHSIECLDEAAKLLDSLNKHEGDEAWEEVRMAALLHDIGHVPFSHTLEDENVVLTTAHDKEGRVSDILGKLKGELDTQTADLVDKAAPILLAISGKKEEDRDWRSDLVGNTVCADLLAYITTDAAWTGIEKRPGYYRIYDYFTIANKNVQEGVAQPRLCIRLSKGGLRTDIVSAILDLLDMRYALTERVIFHHAKAIASAMLARAARLAGLKYNQCLLDMGDETFLGYLEGLASNVQEQEVGNAALMIFHNLRARNLYKRVFKVERQEMEEWNRKKSNGEHDTFCAKWRDGERVEELLTKIEERFGIPYGSLVLWCPEGKSGMKLVKAHVTWEQGAGWHEPVELRSEAVKHQYAGVHERVQTIERQYLDLWTFWIAIHPDQLQSAPAIIDALSAELDIACDSTFVDTYAKARLAGFAESSTLHESLEDAWRTDVMPKASRRMRDIAARPGTAIDKAVVKETIHEVSTSEEAPRKSPSKRTRSEQTELLELEGQSKEESEK